MLVGEELGPRSQSSWPSWRGARPPHRTQSAARLEIEVALVAGRAQNGMTSCRFVCFDRLMLLVRKPNFVDPTHVFGTRSRFPPPFPLSSCKQGVDIEAVGQRESPVRLFGFPD
jgi:hypothetical protein